MDIIQIVAIGIIATVLAVTVRKQAPEFSILISITAGILIFLIVLPKLESVLTILKNISDNVDLNMSYILIVFKIIGISYLAEFGAQICQDAGEGVIASKIEMAGKILIIVISAPILLTLLNMLLSMF